MKPSFSIIVPLYNKKAWIQATLNALIEQMEPSDEILVVDDRSTDNSPEIARSLFETIPGYGRVINLSENSGPASSRNVGARFAKNSHLLFFDADDIPSPTLLQTLRKAIERHPFASVFAYHIAFQARGDVVPQAEELVENSTIIRPLHSFAMDSLRGKTLCTASSTCVTREAFLSTNGGFQEGLRYCEDPEFWARLSAIYQIIEIDLVLAVYRDVPASLSYELRGVVGTVNPYVASLQSLAKQYGGAYTLLAKSILFKNLAFSRAAGASRQEIYQQIYQHRLVLGLKKSVIFHCINLLPSAFFRKAFELRSRLLVRINSRQKRT